jgi:hypothetical protein
MRYIDRRFLLPVAAATAWAQQQTPEAAEAEAALRTRAEEFFKLQVDKKYRQAESMVAEDTKDLYYDNGKFNIKNFTVQKIELQDDNTRARVTGKARVTMVVQGASPIDLDAPSVTTWKMENGAWMYYVDQSQAVMTPFGRFKPGVKAPSEPGLITSKLPDIATLQNAVKADRDAVTLTQDAPRQSVVITNSLPGGVDLALSGDHLEGISVKIARKHLEAGENTSVEFSETGGTPGSQSVTIVVSPLNTLLNIQVTRK